MYYSRCAIANSLHVVRGVLCRKWGGTVEVAGVFWPSVDIIGFILWVVNFSWYDSAKQVLLGLVTLTNMVWGLSS